MEKELRILKDAILEIKSFYEKMLGLLETIDLYGIEKKYFDKAFLENYEKLNLKEKLELFENYYQNVKNVRNQKDN